MIINVWFYGQFFMVAGRKQSVTLRNGSYLKELLQIIISDHGSAMRNLLKDESMYFITINGNYISPSIYDQKKLEEGDVVAFQPIITGG